MLKKSWQSHFFSPAVYLIAGVFFIHFALPTAGPLGSQSFMGHVKLQNCPPPSQNPECATATPEPPATKPPTAVPPTSAQPNSVTLNPEVSAPDSNNINGGPRNRHATLTALAYVIVISTNTATSAPTTQVADTAPSVTPSPTPELSSTESTVTPPVLSTPKGTPKTFFLVTAIFVVGILVAAVMLRR